MYQRILITGGAGFIGSHLSLRLTDMGCDVTVLDNLSPQIHGKISPLFETIRNRVRFIKGDVRHREDWVRAIDAQEAVIHLAAETGTGQSMYEIERYVDVNIRGTALMLDVLAHEPHSIRKLLLASSRAIYGEGKAHCANCGIVYPRERKEEHLSRGDFCVKCPMCGRNTEVRPTDENSKQHPSSIYGITKLTQEQLMLTAGTAMGIAVSVLRYQNVYGPGQSLTNPYTGILSIFSTRILNGHYIDVFEDGNETRDFVYVDDVIDATIAALTSHDLNNQVFNVGSGVQTSIVVVASLLAELFNKTTDIRISGKFRIGDIRHNVASIERIHDQLAYMPRFSFNEGLKRFVSWAMTQEIPEDTYDKSTNEIRQIGMMHSNT